MSVDLRRRQGLILVAIISGSTLWLAFTGQLELYVAPRHAIFATVMAGIGLIAALFCAAGSASGDNQHRHEQPVPRRAMIAGRFGTGLALLVAATLLVLPPATLSSATASQREVNSAALASTGTTVEAASEIDDDAAYANLSLADWASLLRQTSELGFYQGKTVSVLGFITEDPEDPDDVFYISRFYIWHCTLDAQAVGVPVYMENWKDTFRADQWVTASGEFGVNASGDSTQALVLDTSDVTVVDQPDDPYLYS